MSEAVLKIYNASAGSGKTYTLVKEYLRIILPDPYPKKFQRILAMTFTNKAANEMKERIVQKLIQLSKNPADRTQKDSEEITNFARDLKMSEQELTAQANTCLNAILHHYGLFSVMTIDKFTHKVIRTFAKELGLSLDFEVELDLETLRRNVADLLFDRIGRDDEITRLMKQYALSNLDDDKSWNFRQSLIEFSEQLFKEDALLGIQQLADLGADDFLKAQKEIMADRKKFENHLKSVGQEALDAINSKGLDGSDFHYGNSGGAFAYFTQIATGNKFEVAGKRFRASVENDKWASSSTSNEGAVQEITPILQSCYDRIQNYIEKERPAYLLNLELLKLINNLSLLNHLLQITEELKAQDNVLLISDFYKTISDVITKEPVPFIYERLGVKYEHFLLDEFQDTSHLQWVNLVPLLHNSVAMNKPNLIVGDGKQAIYRWRNGEVEQFIELPYKVHNPENIVSLQEAENSFKSQGKLETLGTNYRSAKEIVNFNNNYFKNLIADKDEFIQKIYNKSDQEVSKDHKGYVEIKAFSEKEDLLQLTYIQQVIDRALEKEYALKDICILVKTNRQGSNIARYLATQGIKVISQDSLHVSKDIKVKFVFNLLCAIANSHNVNHAKKCIEQFDKIKGHEQHLLEMLDTKKINVVEWFQKQGVALKPNEHFHSFYEFVEHLIAAFEFDLSKNVYLQFFLEQIHDFEKRHSANLHSFIDWFNELGYKHSIQSPEGANAVQVMTIHKAKGLQFPVVICAFFDWDLSKNKSQKWIIDDKGHLPAFPLKVTKNTKSSSFSNVILEEDRKHILDQINLIYVAFTRPETALFVTGTTAKNSSVMKDWILPHVKDIPTVEEVEDLFSIGSFITSDGHEEGDVTHLQIAFCQQIMDKPQLSTKMGDQWDIHDLDKKREFGTHLHQLLSEIQDESGLEKELKRLIQKGIIPEASEEKLRSKAIDLFNDAHFSSYFKAESVMNEKAIIDEEGRKHIPDKVIKKDNEVLVVDFKTGEELLEKHQKQVIGYMDLLKELGHSNVKGEIYYTESLKAVSV